LSRLYAGLVMAAAVLAVAFAPTAAQARSSSCRTASTARGSKIVRHDRDAVVFRRHGSDVLRACAFGHSVRKLTQLCCEGVRDRLAGHFLAYTYQGTAIGDETNKLGVINLTTGRLERLIKFDPHGEGGGREIETSSFVTDFEVSSHGALVWIEDVLTSFDDPHCAGCPTGQREVRAADGKPPREHVVDSGKISPRSLRISRDHRSILYVKDGRRVSAPLHR
jgi:hypothetical protein